MPGVGAHLVLPDFRAAMHASLMCSGVSKSGSPAAKPQTSSPAACRALALASTASVGDGETLRAQRESGAGGLLMANAATKMPALPKGKLGGGRKKSGGEIRRSSPARRFARYFLFFAFGGIASIARRSSSPTLA